MKFPKLIKYLEECVEQKEWSPTYKDEAGQWFDKWEQSDCSAQGHSEGYIEGYCKAMNEVIILLKKENK